MEEKIRYTEECLIISVSIKPKSAVGIHFENIIKGIEKSIDIKNESLNNNTEQYFASLQLHLPIKLEITIEPPEANPVKIAMSNTFIESIEEIAAISLSLENEIMTVSTRPIREVASCSAISGMTILKFLLVFILMPPIDYYLT